MLYVTTLDRTVTYTAQATLERATGPEGGLFVPMTLPQYDREGAGCRAGAALLGLCGKHSQSVFPLQPPG